MLKLARIAYELFTIKSEKKKIMHKANKIESAKVLNATFFNSGSNNLVFSFLRTVIRCCIKGI